MVDLDVGGDYINVLIMDRMLMDQKKNFNTSWNNRIRRLLN